MISVKLFIRDKSFDDKPTIIVINNFDVYLNIDEIINLLNTINKYTTDNCHFILSSCNNIFEYLDLEKYNIYKITNKLIGFNVIDDAIKIYLLKNEFNINNNKMIFFDDFYKENEFLIDNNEIMIIKYNILNKYPSLIGKILNAENIKVVLKKPKHITSEYIICDNKDSMNLFLEIYDKFID